MYEHLPFKDIIPIIRIPYYNFGHERLYYLDRIMLEIKIFIEDVIDIGNLNTLIMNELHYSIAKKFFDILKNNINCNQFYILDKRLFNNKDINKNIRLTLNSEHRHVTNFSNVLNELKNDKQGNTQFVIISPALLTPLILDECLVEKDVYMTQDNESAFRFIKSKDKNINYIVSVYQNINEMIVFSTDNDDSRMMFYYDIPPNFMKKHLYSDEYRYCLEMMFKFVGNIHAKRLVIT